MNLIIDIGNSYTKTAVFQKGKFLKQSITENAKLQNDYPETFFSADYTITAVIVSSVKKQLPEAINEIKKKIPEFWVLHQNTPLPIKNLYQTPETLGKDRLAAAVGANALFPETNLLVIDAGTALTVDFVSDKNAFTGGIISPGLQMRFNALHKMTDRLPLCFPDAEFSEISAQRTEDALKAGVQNSMIFEISTYIDRYSYNYPGLKTVLTGGDVFFFANTLKKKIFAKPDLVIFGLNKILEFNYANKN